MIAACLIVKNEEQVIQRCLDSLRPFVDEINVYDTGSTDGTLELLEGERVERGEWRDDFSWARERSFEMASPEHEWLLTIDADELVESGDPAEFRRAVDATSADGIEVIRWGLETDVWKLQLVRRDAGVSWVSSIHEYLDLPEERRIRLPAETLRFAHRRVPGTEAARLERNLRMLEAQAQREYPDISAYTLHRLFVEWVTVGRYDKALGPAVAFLRHPDSEEDEQRALVEEFVRVASCA